MSTIVDFSYRFEGEVKKIAKARAAIKKYQVDNAQYSGNGMCDYRSKPVLDESGALSWYCYAKNHMNDFDAILTPLTKGEGLRVWAYWGTTDGCSESGLNLIENGVMDGVQGWGAEIGLDAAMAMVRLSKTPTAQDLLILIRRFNLAVKDGWDEEDHPWLTVAELMATQIGRTLTLNAGFTKNETLAGALVDMQKKLRNAVRQSLVDYAGRAPSELGEIDGLLATIEALEIAPAAHAHAPGATNARAIRL